MKFRRLRMAVDRRKLHQVVEPEHTESRCPFKEKVQQIGRGPDVVERSVRGLIGEAKMRRERTEAAVRNFGANESSGKATRVDDSVREGWIVVRGQRLVQETQVKPNVVTDDHSISHEIKQRLKHLLDSRRGENHRLRDTREIHNLRRDQDPRVDKRLKCTGAAAAFVTRSRQFSNCASIRRRTGCFDVDYAERNHRKWHAKIVERLLAWRFCRARGCGRGCRSSAR